MPHWELLLNSVGDSHHVCEAGSSHERKKLETAELRKLYLLFPSVDTETQTFRNFQWFFGRHSPFVTTAARRMSKEERKLEFQCPQSQRRLQLRGLSWMMAHDGSEESFSGDLRAWNHVSL